MKELLRALDVTESEVDVLSLVIENQPCTATQLIELTGQHRKVIYDILYRLVNRSLITSKKEGKQRLFWFSGNAGIDAYVQEQRERLEEKAEILEELKKTIQKIKPVREPESYTLSGKQGIRQIVMKLVEEEGEYLVIGAPKESEEIMGTAFWSRINVLQKERQDKARFIFNAALREYGDSVKNENIQIRYFNFIDPLTETAICGDYVVHMIWTQVPQIHVIKSTQYADSQRDHFSLLWEQAKE